MNKELKDKRVAILVADGFEQVEMTEPRKALEEAGAKTELVSPSQKEVQGLEPLRESKQIRGRRGTRCGTRREL